VVALPGLLVLAALAIYWTLIPARARRATFTCVSLAALAVYAPLSVAVLAVLTGLAWALLSAEGKPSRPRFLAAVGLCVLTLAVHKYAPLRGLRLIGTSYAVLRLIHVALEVRRGRLAPPGLGRFVEYTLFPPSFLSGPIERLPDFERGADPTSLSLDAAFWGARRILFGLLKKMVLVAPLLGAAEARFTAPGALAPLQAWEGLLAYSLYIYLDFSAYCDIALGVARLFGYQLSENFRWPYLAEDIADFWRRWHITLSTWLRDYIYLPATVELAHTGNLRQSPLLIACLATIVTMVVCGIWHGNGASFILWGLGHGLLLAGHLVYQQRVLRLLAAPRRRALLASAPYRAGAGLATFAAVSVLWLFFRFRPREALVYGARLLGLS
jgi:alginate O-acetyltransferase complex protein AlgI